MSELEKHKEALSSVYILCEEKEEEGIREFRILATSLEETDLTPLLDAKFKKDEYGLFGANGVSYQSGTAVKSRYGDDGAGVEYYILEEPVLSKKQLQALLETSEYDTAFHYPDNLRKVVTDVFQSMADDSYPDLDVQKVVDDVMQNKSYQAMIKHAWWATDDHMDEHSVQFAASATYSWLQDLLSSRPDYFEEIGVREPFACSEDLRNILIDAIYDVSKQYRLYVNNVELETDRILANGTFRAIVRTFDTDQLHAGSEQYKKLFSACCDFVSNCIVPEEKRDPKKPDIDTLVTDAFRRKKEQTNPLTTQQGKER